MFGPADFTSLCSVECGRTSFEVGVTSLRSIGCGLTCVVSDFALLSLPYGL